MYSLQEHYQQVKIELSLADGLVYIHWIVVPVSERKDTLQKLHEN